MSSESFLNKWGILIGVGAVIMTAYGTVAFLEEDESIIDDTTDDITENTTDDITENTADAEDDVIQKSIEGVVEFIESGEGDTDFDLRRKFQLPPSMIQDMSCNDGSFVSLPTPPAEVTHKKWWLF
tara:strand:+ start:2031 stop:2408 length:378 start_codon:yes stop_codon:yes gene_type:complete